MYAVLAISQLGLKLYPARVISIHLCYYLKPGLLAILARSIEIFFQVIIAILFAVLPSELPQIYFNLCCCVQLFLNFGLILDYVIMWSTWNLTDKQVVLTCYFSFSPFHSNEQKNEKILCVIKQHPHD